MSKSSTSFRPGKSGNPAGRPLGSKDAITKAFLDAATADFEEHGKDALVAAREKNPNEYCRMIASILPKDQNVNVKDEVGAAHLAALKGLADGAELAKEIARLEEENAALRGDDPVMSAEPLLQAITEADEI